jgi:hypothetical protein
MKTLKKKKKSFGKKNKVKGKWDVDKNKNNEKSEN